MEVNGACNDNYSLSESVIARWFLLKPVFSARNHPK